MGKKNKSLLNRNQIRVSYLHAQRNAEQNQAIALLAPTDDENRITRPQMAESYPTEDFLTQDDSFCQKNGVKLAGFFLTLMAVGAVAGTYAAYTNSNSDSAFNNPLNNNLNKTKSNCSLDDDISPSNHTRTVRSPQGNIKMAVDLALSSGYNGEKLDTSHNSDLRVENAYKIGSTIARMQQYYPNMLGTKSDPYHDPRFMEFKEMIRDDPCILYSSPSEIYQILRYTMEDVRQKNENNDFLLKMQQVNEDAGCRQGCKSHVSYLKTNYYPDAIYANKEEAMKYAPQRYARIY